MNPSNSPASVQLSESSLLRAQLVAAQGAINALSQQLAYADMQMAELKADSKAKADAACAQKEKSPGK
jgi:hypothetical protein